MRRPDRLFRLVGLLQRRRTVKASALAERLEVSALSAFLEQTIAEIATGLEAAFACGGAPEPARPR